jgi:pilus assembly protein CpaC
LRGSDRDSIARRCIIRSTCTSTRCRQGIVMHKFLALAATASGLMLCVVVNAAEVGAPPAAGSPTATPPPPAISIAPADIRPTGPPVVLEIGKGTLFHLPRPAATVFVANPDVADVQIKSPSLIYISASKVKPGETVVYAVDDKDNVLMSTVVRVEYDLSRLRQSIKLNMPGERITVSSIEGKLVLSGEVSGAGHAQKARALAAAIVGEDKIDQIVNQLAVITPNQVNLRVRIAEVKRDVLKQLGINWQKLGSHVNFSTNNPTTSSSVNDIIGSGVQNTLIGAIGNCASGVGVVGLLSSTTCVNGFAGTLDALAQEGLITDLAEPNMTAMNGQTASFLVGGSFPVPTSVTAATGGSAPTIGITYKDFGVKLDFTPTILDANHLNLKLRPEVSALTTVGAVSIPLTNTNVVTIPAVTVTRAETTVELGSGQSFALAGLIRHSTTQDISKVPGLGDIPILGQLFRSDQFQRDETELIVIVTPYLVNPVATASLAVPTDGYRSPHDLARIVTDDISRQQLPPSPRTPAQGGSKGLVGAVGFRMD